jgi:cytochrome c-type biogenesis protein CcmH
MRREVATVLAAFLVLALAAPAAFAAACPKTTLGDVEDEVMCPVCGTPLNLATEAPQAQRERQFIERLIAQCRSKDEIKQTLRAQFGDRVLATPDDKGFDLAAYLVPALAVLLGLGGVALAARRWRRARPRPGPPPPAPASAARSRLESDLERYDL